MIPSPLVCRLFGLMLWLATSLTSQAEPQYPLLKSTAIDSLRAILRQGTPDTNRVKALIALSTYFIDRNETNGAPFDSTYAYGQQAEQLSNTLGFARGQISSKYVLGRFLALNNNVPAGKTLLRQGLALSRQMGELRLAADGWYHLAAAYNGSAAEMPERLRYLQYAAARYAKLRDLVNEAFILKTIADAHFVQGNNVLAHQELLHVLALYQSMGYKRLHYTFDLLTAVSISEGDYKEALKYSFATLKNARMVRDTAVLVNLFIRMSSIYKNLNQLDNSLAYLRLGLEQAHREQNTFYVLHTASSMATILISQHKPQQALALLLREIKAYPPADKPSRYPVEMGLVSCYTATRQYSLAEKHAVALDSLLQYGKLYPQGYGYHMTAYLRISRLFIAARQYTKARIYLGRAQAIQAKAVNLDNESTAQLLWFKVDSAQGHLSNAITHYQRYKALRDFIFSEKQGQLVARLQVQYDTEKREQSIALLTKQSQVQQARIRQREFQRNTVVIGALLLAGLLILSYSRYRLKQRAAHLLEAQQDEINRQNLALQHLLTEKDWMLKEIHHRVKNNLEVISSLLETQSDYLHDPAALTALREGQNRVHAMALIHQKLYQSDSLSVVDMAAYIHEITEHLLESFDCQNTVQMHLAVAPVELDVTLATPLGLIINEALTNVFKYAFPGQRPGSIMVELVVIGPQRFRLTIEDDGVGFPPGIDTEDGRTMGLTIMRGLSEQIDGILSITQKPGVRISLDFEALNSVVRVEPEE